MTNTAECRHESGPLAIFKKYEKYLEGRRVPKSYEVFEYDPDELQQPVAMCCLDSLKRVLAWQNGEYRHHLVFRRRYPIPMLVQDPANNQAYIHLDSGIPEDVIGIPFGD
jgi:hypothetical protein